MIDLLPSDEPNVLLTTSDKGTLSSWEPQTENNKPQEPLVQRGNQDTHTPTVKHHTLGKETARHWTDTKWHHCATNSHSLELQIFFSKWCFTHHQQPWQTMITAANHTETLPTSIPVSNLSCEVVKLVAFSSGWKFCLEFALKAVGSSKNKTVTILGAIQNIKLHKNQPRPVHSNNTL